MKDIAETGCAMSSDLKHPRVVVMCGFRNEGDGTDLLDILRYISYHLHARREHSVCKPFQKVPLCDVI